MWPASTLHPRAGKGWRTADHRATPSDGDAEADHEGERHQECHVRPGDDGITEVGILHGLQGMPPTASHPVCRRRWPLSAHRFPGRRNVATARAGTAASVALPRGHALT